MERSDHTPDSRSQYIELYRANRSHINAHSTPALNALRERALRALESEPLPRRGQEGYERSDINAMFAPDFGLNIMRIPMAADARASFRCDVPNMSTLLGVVTNDMFTPADTLARNLPEGVTFTTISHAAGHNPELISRYYASVAPLQNPAVALNTLLAQDGVLIHVSKGVKVDRPLQLLNIFSALAPLMAVRRVLIIMDEDAEAQVLVCDHTQDSQNHYLASEVTEICLAPRAKLSYCSIEETSPLTSRVALTAVSQQQGSHFTYNTSSLRAGTTRNSLIVNTESHSCHTEIAGMAIASQHMAVDNSVSLSHLSHHCSSRQLFKYVVADHASCAFQGKIFVGENAPFTDASQTCRSVLSGPHARMHSKPQLEIYNDEVRCSHGATTGQLDAEALFYMRTRGIPEPEARTMLMQAFVADVIDTVKMDGLRDRLRHLVELRFSGSHTGSCAACATSCNQPKEPAQ